MTQPVEVSYLEVEDLLYLAERIMGAKPQVRDANLAAFRDIAERWDEVLDAIDERTRLVAISHVLFRSAYVMDVDAICRAAHDAGALVSLDAFHSVGIMPVDVRRSGADFVTGGVLKWLCGGPGGCFLYVAPAVRRPVGAGRFLPRAATGSSGSRGRARRGR